MQTRSSSVLIVDERAGGCRSIQTAIAARGIECRTATSMGEAIELLGAHAFDVLAAGALLSGPQGAGRLADIRRRAPACKIILMIDDDDRQRLPQALVLGVYDYVPASADCQHIAEAVLAAIRDEDGAPKLPLHLAAERTFSQTDADSLQAVCALAKAIEARDPHTCRHSEQVAHYAVQFARASNQGEAATETLRRAALLHDIGMIGVPDWVLTKKEPLTEEEFQLIRRHPAFGAEILASVALFQEEARLVRHHHERWDGSGYPDSLVGEQIPVGARLIQLADCMDAMLMNRAYRTGYRAEYMFDELMRCAGTQFDPRLAAVAVGWARMNPKELATP